MNLIAFQLIVIVKMGDRRPALIFNRKPHTIMKFILDGAFGLLFIIYYY